MGAFFVIFYTVLWENWIPPKTRALLSGTLPLTLDLENFQVDPVVNKTRRRSSLYIARTMVDASALLDARSLLHVGRP